MNSRDWQTHRRLQALVLYNKGWQQKTIAEALGVSKGAVSQWLKKARGLSEAEQSAALQGRKSSGRPPCLTSKQQRQIASLVDKNAEDFGFIGAFWTAKRVMAVARRELGLVVSVSTVVRCLKAQGYSPQKPERVAREQNERQIAGFRGGWANLKKGQSTTERP